ncbi:MAG TPA: DUF5683 domain-containing protein [Luteibaculaceae bacterium]|nr:DUF5683 domain-containing protein [Luteibaculaceae bacterium]
MANRRHLRLLTFTLWLMLAPLASSTLFAQDSTYANNFASDSLKLERKLTRSPRKASILSAVVPGAGQIYNKQYLWAPVFWAAIGTSAYYISYNTKQFRDFKQAYVLATDNIAGNEDPRFANNSPNFLLQGTDFYRRNRDLSYAAFGLSYLLNIVQASVGAHLFKFRVDENISLNIQPYSTPTTYPTLGARLVLNL